jgi:hypothetical protein
LVLQSIPKIRNKLESLKIKDRFQAKQASPSPPTGLENYLEKLEKSINTKIRKRNCNIADNIRFANNERPFSIADSEIQKVSDFGGNGLIRDMSTISIDTHHKKPSLP